MEASELVDGELEYVAVHVAKPPVVAGEEILAAQASQDKRDTEHV